MRGYCELADHDLLVSNLLATYLTATEDTKAAGRRWYDDAREVVRILARDSNTSAETVAAVIAILSPNTSWGRNVAGAGRMLHAHMRGEACPLDATLYHKNARKAWEVLNGARFETVVCRETSPKVWAFYHNLIGDEETVTVDTWMIRAAGICLGRKDSNGTPTPTEIARVALAIKDAARRVAETPAQFQAIVWVAIRGRED